MQRILTGAPQHSNGALTIVARAQEAGVPRNALTQRHPDLRNEFYDHVRRRGAVPDSEARLRATVATLRKSIASKNEELGRLRADVPALVRVVHQLTVENHRLRERSASGDPRVVPLRPHPPG
ncbi:hypothetical protein SAMN05216371_8117 [Streptomyces sp. TLI_053]|uniref:hypothetical protein n=1 Tax=Streptomyces sp. TLI_053 TaxID=1855352 RepID=UPI00087CCBCD|nr:hypothetical protein [Streptomyces sp. TLI_053]SDT83297.1 hypothetical protein SAMN05216371_8117 [Streptomyces sp. TLI_053]